MFGAVAIVVAASALTTPNEWPSLGGWALGHGTLCVYGAPLFALLWVACRARIGQLLCCAAVIALSVALGVSGRTAGALALLPVAGLFGLLAALTEYLPAPPQGPGE